MPGDDDWEPPNKRKRGPTNSRCPFNTSISSNTCNTVSCQNFFVQQLVIKGFRFNRTV
jgi:hypothetical protein